MRAEKKGYSYLSPSSSVFTPIFSLGEKNFVWARVENAWALPKKFISLFLTK